MFRLTSVPVLSGVVGTFWLVFIIIIIIIIITAIELSLGGSSPYTSTEKTNNIHKRNDTKTQ